MLLYATISTGVGELLGERTEKVSARTAGEQHDH